MIKVFEEVAINNRGKVQMQRGCFEIVVGLL